MDTPPTPTSPDQLTAEWFTYALNEGGLDGVVVSDIEVSPLAATSGNSGSYAVVQLAYSRQVGGAPDSLFAKMTAESLRGFLGNSYVREIAAYREYLPRLQISVPRLYYGTAEPAGGPAILLLKNMSEHRLGDFNVGASEAEIAAAVTALAKIHSPYWADERPSQDSRLFNEGYGEEKSAYQNSEFLAGMALGIPRSEELTEYITAALARIGEDFLSLGDRIMSSPRTLSHSDYRIDNLLYSRPPAQPQVTVFDWGVTGTMKSTYDLALFLTSAYMPANIDAARDPVDLYFRELQASGIADYSRDELQFDYATAALLMLHRFLTGTYWAMTGGGSEQVLGMRRTGLRRCARHIELLQLADILN